jgi:nitroimidazol reductase NimA-like FMN-containing flavoprotein (pyridoxamine 5'-phosphate oxidase superfamily)
MKLSAKEKQFVECLRVARVATVGSDNIPHNVPVCPVFDKNKVYFGTERNARKARNIQSNPNVTMTFDEYSEDWEYLRGVMVQGQGRIVKKSEFRTIRKKIYEKYSQYEESAPLGERDSVIIEVTPKHKFSWGLD